MNMKWAYGITTVQERVRDLLPRTIASLQKGGFLNPRLFIDGPVNQEDYYHFLLELTAHNPKIYRYGNWYLGLMELYCREPKADYYAIFQDDLVTYKNLRQYLEKSNMPKDGYFNLYTVPKNHELCPPGHVGWHPSNGYGVGAVALVFPKEVAIALLTSATWVGQLQQAHGAFSIDAAVIWSIGKRYGGKYLEYVHSPTLVQHTGLQTTIYDKKRFPCQPLADTFRGEEFDALDLLTSR